MKKMITVILALVLILALAAPAFAADTTINITGVSGRTFDAYQLMSASVDTAGGNYHYEVNAKYRSLLAKVINTQSGLALPDLTDASATDQYILSYLEGLATKAAQMRKLTDAIYRAIQADGTLNPEATFTGNTTTLPQGYWLIVDVTDLSGMSGVSNSLVMVDTVGDEEVTISAKPDTPEMYKKIDDVNDSNTSEDALAWRDSADHDIGDAIPYQITVELPNNIETYVSYDFLLADHASKGLTYNPESFTITVAGAPKTIAAAGETVGGVTPDFYYTIATDTASGESFLKVYPSADVYDYDTKSWVDASSTQGGNVLAVGAQNNNTVIFSYTCTLNENAVIGAAGNPNWADFEYSNNPYDKGHGKTPEDVCIAFTYKTTFNKVDGKGQPLSGADFELYKFVQDDSGSEIHDGDKGTWVLDDSKVIDATGTVFSFTGLDDGHYKLVETVTPAGYNGLPDEGLHFTVTADHVIQFDTYATNLLTSLNGKEEVSGTITLTSTLATGELASTVVNNSGAELPSTGGIGTTIFYILGALMATGAGVVMVTRKRVGEE